MDRKKELKEMYKNLRPDMGVFVIRSNTENICYAEAARDLKSAVNSSKCKLDFGSHPCRELQKYWSRDGSTGFTVEVLEKIPYDEGEAKTDYSEELTILKMIWEEKLGRTGMEFFGK